MATRNQRKARAKAKQQAKLEALVTAARAAHIADIVRKNKSAPRERNYYAGIQSSAAMVRDRCMGAYQRPVNRR